MREKKQKPEIEGVERDPEPSEVTDDLIAHPEVSALVLRRFRVVFNAVRGHFQQTEKQVGLGGASIWALSVILNAPGIGMGGIALAMDIHQSTASNLIKTLIKKELVSMTKTEDDRRAVHLRILPAGRKVLRQVSGPFQGVLPVALAKLPANTLKRLNQDLQAVIDILKADEGAAGIPLAEL